MIPTFDEWHLKKYCMTFDQAHKRPCTMINIYFEALSREIRNYHSEVAVMISKKEGRS